MSKPSKVLVIGSGPIIIGQAAEFDYSGTQACRALREEGVTTVLVNSNPATIMTDEGIADIVYIEPLTVEVLDRVIERERPDKAYFLSCKRTLRERWKQTIPERKPSWRVFLLTQDEDLPEDKAEEIDELGMIVYVRETN